MPRFWVCAWAQAASESPDFFHALYSSEVGAVVTNPATNPVPADPNVPNGSNRDAPPTVNASVILGCSRGPGPTVIHRSALDETLMSEAGESLNRW